MFIDEVEEILCGIAETRRTLTPELVVEFEQDIQAYAPRLMADVSRQCVHGGVFTAAAAAPHR